MRHSKQYNALSCIALILISCCILALTSAQGPNPNLYSSYNIPGLSLVESCEKPFKEAHVEQICSSDRKVMAIINAYHILATKLDPPCEFIIAKANAYYLEQFKCKAIEICTPNSSWQCAKPTEDDCEDGQLVRKEERFTGYAVFISLEIPLGLGKHDKCLVYTIIQGPPQDLCLPKCPSSRRPRRGKRPSTKPHETDYDLEDFMDEIEEMCPVDSTRPAAHGCCDDAFPDCDIDCSECGCGSGSGKFGTINKRRSDVEINQLKAHNVFVSTGDGTVIPGKDECSDSGSSSSDCSSESDTPDERTRDHH